MATPTPADTRRTAQRPRVELRVLDELVAAVRAGRPGPGGARRPGISKTAPPSTRRPARPDAASRVPRARSPRWDSRSPRCICWPWRRPDRSMSLGGRARSCSAPSWRPIPVVAATCLRCCSGRPGVSSPLHRALARDAYCDAFGAALTAGRLAIRGGVPGSRRGRACAAVGAAAAGARSAAGGTGRPGHRRVRRGRAGPEPGAGRLPRRGRPRRGGAPLAAAGVPGGPRHLGRRELVSALGPAHRAGPRSRGAGRAPGRAAPGRRGFSCSPASSPRPARPSPRPRPSPGPPAIRRDRTAV